ncbi:MAG: extracellular solute-binding protein [Burkholderiales bacterium]|nr:extracellular solute-binding protein [Anaerolineae bacterium]
MRKQLFVILTLVVIAVMTIGPVIAQSEADLLDPAYFGLQEGQPFAGTHLNYLICCAAAPQFASLAAKTNEEFTAMTGISVTWADVPYADFQSQLVLEASSGTGTYDVVSWVDAWGPGVQAFMLPLNERMEAAGLDLSDFPPVYQEVAMIGTEDTIYGIPLRGHAQMLMYRQDVFDELGLEVPTTWQEVAEVGAMIEEQTELEAISMYYGVSGNQNLFNWLSHLWGAGGEIFDADFNATFNSPEGIAATQQYVSFMSDGLTADGAIAFGEGEGEEELLQGRAAMFVGWWWMFADTQNPERAAPEVQNNIGFAPAPGWEGGSAASYGYLWPVGILSSSTQQDAAFEYLKWLTHPTTEARVALDETPAFLNNVVVRNSTLQDEAVNERWGGLQSTAAEILADARTMPLIPEWPEVEAILTVAVNDIASGADTTERLNQAAADVDAVMERAGY